MAAALLSALVLITLFSIYLFGAHPWWLPIAASIEAHAIDRQFTVALWLLGCLFAAGQLILGLALFRRRRPAYPQGSRLLEITWTLAVAGLFFGFNMSGERLWSEIRLHQPPADDAIQVEATGAQFQWYFRYPGPDRTFGRTDPQRLARANEGNPLGIDANDPAGKDDVVSTSLVLPAGRDVDLILHAQDVIHGLFIPAMRFKQDAVPGMDMHVRLKPQQIGTFEITCSQLCGLGHYRMRSVMKVVNEEEFKEWLKRAS